ncbi:hypothetical protein PLICRDRAFT_520316 [Plicaturopsis crispa FD-325 SS-3]|nr:hypothetical protein PLICRDRAFT_520316 [Plicaturopsis crispa FD-325 SS-3]
MFSLVNVRDSTPVFFLRYALKHAGQYSSSSGATASGYALGGLTTAVTVTCAAICMALDCMDLQSRAGAAGAPSRVSKYLRTYFVDANPTGLHARCDGTGNPCQHPSSTRRTIIWCSVQHIADPPPSPPS